MASVRQKTAHWYNYQKLKMLTFVRNPVDHARLIIAEQHGAIRQHQYVNRSPPVLLCGIVQPAAGKRL